MTQLTSVKEQLSKHTLTALGMAQRGLARHHGEHGLLARNWPTGSMVLWVAVLLGFSLVLYYF
jgi:multicomponent Na+:H+ antiporter subunit D